MLNTSAVKKAKMPRRIKLKLGVGPSQAHHSRRTSCVSVGTAVAVILTFLAVTLAYACPGLAFMHTSGYAYSKPAHHIKADPCHRAKKDICQSVRDRMLSVQVTSLHFLMTASLDFAGFSFLLVTPKPQSGQISHLQRMLLLYLKTSKPPSPLYTTVLRI